MTDVFLADPRELSDDLRADLLKEFGPEEIVEMTAILALFLNFSKLVITLGLEPEDMPITVTPTPDFPPGPRHRDGDT